MVLGVAGGIAAYKAVSLLRLMKEAGYNVQVVPTAAALEFVGRPTWAALSGNPVHATVWEDALGVEHVTLGKAAQLVIVAPATADLLARAVAGQADDLLTATLLTARCPVLMVPAMHTEMWTHPATVANVATLRARGVVVLDPAVGRLTGADSGPGRLPEPPAILSAARALLHTGVSADLAGQRLVISAGGTREPVDPVRFLGNRSSGKQGFALAAAAAARGARVTLVAANVELPDPAGAALVRVGTAAQLREAVLTAAAEADVVIMAAAVADYRPAEPAVSKLKKDASPNGEPTPLKLARNPDILAELVSQRRAGILPAGLRLVGFAAETGDERGAALTHAQAKLLSKGVDLLVYNDVSGGKVFGQDDTTVHLLTPSGRSAPAVAGSKESVAHAILDAVKTL